MSIPSRPAFGGVNHADKVIAGSGESFIRTKLFAAPKL